MNPTTARIVTKNVVVAITLFIAAIATWAVTDSKVPSLEAAAVAAPHA